MSDINDAWSDMLHQRAEHIRGEKDTARQKRQAEADQETANAEAFAAYLKQQIEGDNQL